MEKQRRLRTWLVNIVTSGKVPNLEWLNKEKNVFKIPWKHESRNDWDPSHAQVFTEWARFTGKHREGIDKPDYKMFKTRLRCAFNKAPDIEEIVEMRRYKGAAPYRVYRLLDYDKKPAPKKSTLMDPVVPVVATNVSKPPVMVEEMVDNDNYQQISTQKTMDLLQAVEAERELQKKLETKQHHNIKKTSNEKLKEMQEFDLHNSDLGQQIPESAPKQVEDTGLKDDPNAQSLILLQSTRYRCTLLKNLFDLQKSGILCDLLLKVKGGHVIPVHANVMCACSPFFKHKVDHWNIGHSGDTEGGCMVIKFDEISFDILNSIIQFIYMGEFEVARGSLPIVHTAANLIKLDDLSILCEHVLKALKGTLMDEKSNKPILPKQAPLSAPPVDHQTTHVRTPLSRESSYQQLPPVKVDAPLPPEHQPPPPPSQHQFIALPDMGAQALVSVAQNGPPSGPPIYPQISTNGFTLPQRPMGKVVTSIPPISELEASQMRRPNFQHDNAKMQSRGTVQEPPPRPALLIPKSILNNTTSSAPIHAHNGPLPSWHIPQAARNSPEEMPGQNPLDVLCQAVDETIRSESQSEDESNLVIDESPSRKPSQDAKNNSSSRLQLKPGSRPVDCIPPVYQTKLPGEGVKASAQPVNSQPLCIPTSIIQSVSGFAAVQVQPQVMSPLARQVSPSGQQASPPAQVHQASPHGPVLPPAMGSPPQALIIPQSIITGCAGNTDVSNQQNKETLRKVYQCNVCPKIFVSVDALEAHMNTHTAGPRHFSCKFCSKSFRHGSSRHYHQLGCMKAINRTTNTLRNDGDVNAKQIHKSLKDVRKKRGSSDDDVSEEHIRSIIDRIMSKTKDEYNPNYSTLLGFKGDYKRTSSNQLPSAKRIKRTKIFPRERKVYGDVVVIEDEEEKRERQTSISIPPISELVTDNVRKANGEDKFQCNECQTVFVYESSLEMHLKACNSGNSSNRHSCEHCSKLYSSEEGLNIHKKSCGTPPVVLDHICDQCGKMFGQSSELEAHIKRHEKIKVLTCEVCKKVCKSKMLLKFHVEMHASHKLRFSCMACGKHFLTKKKLEVHVQMHVSRMEKTEKDRLFECDICKSTFSKKSELIVHINKHEVDQQKEMTESTEKLQEQSEDSQSESVPSVGRLNEGVREVLPDHIDTEDDNTMELPPSKSSNQLREAGISSDGVAESRTCLICNESFPDQIKKMVHCMSHFQFHTDTAKVICQICMVAVDKQDIPMHEKSHAKDKPLQCPHCDGAFTNTEELNSHVTEDHQAETSSIGSVSPSRQEHPSETGGTYREERSQLERRGTGARNIQEIPCEHCKAVFSSVEGWQEHVLMHLKPSRSARREPLVCNVCDRVFSSKYATYEYKRHMCSHTGERPIACRFCEKTFKDYSGRSQHEKRVHHRGPMARGRHKGMRSPRIASPQPLYHGMRDKASRPPPLVNLNMLSDEVRRQFFPSLQRTESPEYPSDSGPQSSGDTSEEEDLSIMVALKGQGRQSAEGYNKAQKPGPLPPYMYSSAVTNGQTSPTRYDCVHTSQAGMPHINLYGKYHNQDGPPLELLSHLTTSKGNPTLVNSIPMDTISGASSNNGGVPQPEYTAGGLPKTRRAQSDNIRQMSHADLSLSSRSELQCMALDLARGAYCGSEQLSPNVGISTSASTAFQPRLARVGDQLKVSTMVAPQVRKPPPLMISDDIDKQGYPKLLKKRPVDPKFLIAAQGSVVAFDNDIDGLKQKMYEREGSQDSALGSMGDIKI